jgi:PAS domain S-box-containing protein
MPPSSRRLRSSTLAFLVLATLILALTGWALWELERARRVAEEQLTIRDRVLRLVEQLATATQVRSRHARTYLLTGETSHLNAARQAGTSVEAVAAELDRDMETPEARALLRRFIEAQAANAVLLEQFVALREQGVPVEDFGPDFTARVEPSRQALDEALQALRTYAGEEMAQVRAAVGDRQQVAMRLVAALAVLGLILALAGGMLAARAHRHERAARLADAGSRRDKQFLDTLLDSLRAGVAACDAEGRLTLCNREAREYLGLPAGLTPLDQWPEYHTLHEADGATPLDAQQTPLARALRGDAVDDQEVVITTRDGASRTVLVSGRLIADPDGQPIGAVVAMLNITARRVAEHALVDKAAELERSNAELERFAYVASHDLQEPLRMVSSYTELLARRYTGRLDEDADTFIAYAVDGVHRMQRLINDLLVYSRVSTRDSDLRPTASGEALQQALANLSRTIEERGAVIDAGPLPDVLADPTQLTQLFQNLVSNAIKFQAEATTPQVTIRAHARDAAWEFSVQDNGIGIAADYFDRIFVLFQRLHTREAFTGTGMGLAICKKIVERHGGRIWVESTEDQGSTFFFTLPAAVPEPAATTDADDH